MKECHSNLHFSSFNYSNLQKMAVGQLFQNNEERNTE